MLSLLEKTSEGWLSEPGIVDGVPAVCGCDVGAAAGPVTSTCPSGVIGRYGGPCYERGSLVGVGVEDDIDSC